MANLKTYQIENINAEKLQKDIVASSLVTGYDGFNFSEGSLEILGDALTDEPSLDALIAAHDPTPTVVIADVTARQIRVALFLTMGMNEQNIDDAINTFSDPEKTVAMIEWKQSNMFERNRPLVATMGAMLGKTSAEMDALWIYAGTL